MANKGELKAVVFGATGAVGSEVLGQLLASPAWKEVVTIGRREAPVPEAYAQYPAGKLQQKVINMDNMEQEAAEAVRGADSVFCALGTTRKAAGSAEKFRRVDLDYVESAAKLASAAKVPHFSLVSSQGANPNLWAPTWSLTHSLYYAKIKGMAEEAVKACSFPHTTILRPGLLDRRPHARGVEAVMLKVVPSFPVSLVAEVMIDEAERFHRGQDSGAKPSVRVLSGNEIKRWPNA